MLRAWIVLVLVGVAGCLVEGETPDAAHQDARIPDARVSDAHVSDARVEETPDAGTLEDAQTREDAHALEDAHTLEDATVPLKSWRDVPAGPVAEPRVVCERSWPIAAIPGITTPRIALAEIVVDARGNLFVSGTIAGDQDFGRGSVDVPWAEPPPRERPYVGTLLLALDPSCNVRWSRAYLPAGDDVWHKPVSLSIDSEQNLVLVTQSNQLVIRNLTAAYEASTLDFTRLDQEGVVLTTKRHALGALPLETQASARAGEVLISGNPDRGEPLDFGAGPLNDPARGHDFNALFAANGTLQHAEIFGSAVGHMGALQVLGANGELAAFGENLSSYYVTSLEGPTLVKLDRARNVVWRDSMHPASPTAVVDAALAFADDGALAVMVSYASAHDQPASASFSERDPRGSLVWEMPITLQAVTDDLQPRQLRVGPGHSLAVHAAVSGQVTLGNNVLGAEGELLFQLERGGAPRWQTWLNEDVPSIAVTPDDAVALCGTGANQVFVRKYAR